jgi:hypothetical protein
MTGSLKWPVNSGAMQMISRLGYAEYATIDDVWRMRRPD